MVAAHLTPFVDGRQRNSNRRVLVMNLEDSTQPAELYVTSGPTALSADEGKQWRSIPDTLPPTRKRNEARKEKKKIKERSPF